MRVRRPSALILAASSLPPRPGARAPRPTRHRPTSLASGTGRPTPGGTTASTTRTWTRPLTGYVAHLVDSTVQVLDTPTLDVVATIEGLDEVHGLGLAPDLDRLYASATGSERSPASIRARTRSSPGPPQMTSSTALQCRPRHRQGLRVERKDSRAETVVDGRIDNLWDRSTSAAAPATASTTPARSTSSSTCRTGVASP